ncbi:alpha-hydroxy acid oxidase [Ornithinicoccus hortensis]|uniref:L-lactate dehydrogenase (Cytochrome) n=1 Tax=Ornithinicoccus hortensis TaxID=82346 RepID=A0A542YS24_9MICO|nr:alpha-hydroxy acid oxidase [Ornithinicoccus hortensis]TQL50902.1 L-lactate dehydrogenase (cytochrome) [Ornithinicoccus hortensis]
MTKRSLPRWSELRPLLQMQPVPLDPVERRLARCHTVADLREAARRRVPRAVFDFVDGAAEGEVSLARSRAAFDRVEFAPAALAGFDEVSTSTTILGTPSALPLVLAPTGFTRLSHHDGEAAVAAAAAEAGIPYALTTMSTVSIEDVAAASGDGTRWFQLYLMRDRGLTRELVRRAKDAGYRALVVTVDTPVVGQRVRDLHNGLTIPPTLTPRTLLDISRRPQWWANLLTTEPLEFATLQAGEPEAHSALIDRLFDPAVTVDDFAPLREWWDGPIVVKGIQSVADARRAVEELGAEALVVSNHGGRQLDRAPTPLELLPRVAEAVGDRTEVLIDSGVRTGADLAAVVALGARAALVGRPYLYGLMAGGRRGVAKTIAVYEAELRRTLHLLGVPGVDALDGSHALLRAA